MIPAAAIDRPLRPAGRPHRIEALWVALGWYLFYSLTNSGHDASEGYLAFRIATHIVQTGQLGLEAPDALFDYLSLPGINGAFYSAHEAGNIVLHLPFAALIEAVLLSFANLDVPGQTEQIRRALASFIPGVFAATGLGLFHWAGRRLYGLAPAQALSGTFGVGLASFYWTYASSHADVLPTAVFLLGATIFLFDHRQSGRPGMLLAAAACLGAAICTRVTSILLLPPFLIYIACVSHPDQRVRAFNLLRTVLCLAPFGIWQMAYNHLRTGNPFLGPVHDPSFAHNNALDGSLIEGLFGLLASTDRSLFLFCPLAAVSLLAFPGWYRRHRAEALLLATFLTGFLLLHARLRAWHGAVGFGPRHFVSIVPLLCLPWMATLATHRTRLRQLLTGAAWTWGILLGAAATISNWFYRHGYLSEHPPSSHGTAHPTQVTDLLVSAGRNLHRIATGSPPDIWTAASPLHQYAANSCDIWLVIAWRQGLPGPAAFALGVVLLAGAILAWRQALAITRS